MPRSNESPITSGMLRRDFLKASSATVGSVAVGTGMLIADNTQATAQEASRPDEATPRVPLGRKAGLQVGQTGNRGCTPEIRAALSGPWPSIGTPFTRHGEIDFPALNRMLDFVIEEGKAKAVVLTWGDSLYSLLTDDEIAEVTKAVCKHVNKRAFVVAADKQWWTGKDVAFAKYCNEVGADMLMVLPPDWAHSTTVDTLVEHYKAISQQIPVMVVTNYLGARGTAFGVELIGRLLREAPGVMALKDDVSGPFIRKVCLLAHERWALSAGGQKQNHLDMYPYGVDGYLSTFISFKPEIAWRYWKAIESGNLPAAAVVIRDYDNPLFDYLLGVTGSFDAGVHGIYELYGLATRYRRRPYYSLTDQEMELLAAFLKGKTLLS